jgi:hypothetical protein
MLRPKSTSSRMTGRRSCDHVAHFVEAAAQDELRIRQRLVGMLGSVGYRRVIVQ